MDRAPMPVGRHILPLFWQSRGAATGRTRARKVRQNPTGLLAPGEEVC